MSVSGIHKFLDHQDNADFLLMLVFKFFKYVKQSSYEIQKFTSSFLWMWDQKHSSWNHKHMTLKYGTFSQTDLMHSGPVILSHLRLQGLVFSEVCFKKCYHL